MFFPAFATTLRLISRGTSMMRLLVLIALMQTTVALPVVGAVNPIMRYRLRPHFEESPSRFMDVLTKPSASNEHSGRNCFFSPIQCQLPVLPGQTIRQTSADRLSYDSDRVDVQRSPVAAARRRIRRKDSGEFMPLRTYRALTF
ncbi:hypothetical protein AAVH_25610 [Aphelenchoides avenae]|nr:hypothetical protein AAVH_25610 [Aphelenchus avenae]